MEIDKVAKCDGIDDAILLVDGLDGERNHGRGRGLFQKGGGMAGELPAAAPGGIDLVDLGAHGATADDEADVYADGEICLAGEVDGDGGAVVALAGGIAHDPEEVDAGAGEAGGAARGIAGVEVLACGGQGARGGHGGGRRERCAGSGSI